MTYSTALRISGGLSLAAALAATASAGFFWGLGVPTLGGLYAVNAALALASSVTFFIAGESASRRENARAGAADQLANPED